MSKLESAFSKAMKEQKPKSGNSGGHSSGADLGGAKQQLPVSSRKQIANMRQEETYSEEELAKRRIIYPGMRDTKLLNIYRNIRTKMIAKAGSANFTTLVTSVVPKGGSSLVSANIAAAFAFDAGKTAMLIDANVHAPALADLFGIDKRSTGLIDFLEGDSLSLDKAISETGVPRLRFVPSGTARENSTEHFTSVRMREFLAEIIQRYPERYPIFDAPSVLESADTRILIDLCDQVVLVVPYGQCTEAQITSAAQSIGTGKLAGLILNQF